jgi:hypothetical protein
MREPQLLENCNSGRSDYLDVSDKIVTKYPIFLIIRDRKQENVNIFYAVVLDLPCQLLCGVAIFNFQVRVCPVLSDHFSFRDFFMYGWTAPVGLELLWASDWSLRLNLYLTTHNTHNIQTSMPAAGCEPGIPASERPQTHDLDRTTAGIGLGSTERSIFPSVTFLCKSILIKNCKYRMKAQTFLFRSAFPSVG